MNNFEKNHEESTEKVHWKKIGLKILFPHTFLVFLLFNITLAGLVYIFSNHYDKTLAAVVFYGISSYTLIIVCARIPKMIKVVKEGVYKNRYAKAYFTDKDLRMRIAMYRGLLINVCFAVFKIVMGCMYHSSWLFAMAGYNMILSLMRFVVLSHSQEKGLSELEVRRRGLQSYYVCGWLVMLLNIAVSVIIFMVIVENKTIEYHTFVAIGLATFTFYCFIRAIIDMVKYKERTNPVYATIKRIDMVKAIVSVFTLQVAMLTSFSGQGSITDHRSMNKMTGIVVTIAINTIGAMMLAGVKKDFKELEEYGKQ